MRDAPKAEADRRESQGGGRGEFGQVGKAQEKMNAFVHAEAASSTGYTILQKKGASPDRNIATPDH